MSVSRHTFLSSISPTSEHTAHRCLYTVPFAVEVAALRYALARDHDKFVRSVLKKDSQLAAFLNRPERIENLKSCQLHRTAGYRFSDQVNPFQPDSFNFPAFSAQPIVGDSGRQSTKGNARGLTDLNVQVTGWFWNVNILGRSYSYE